MMMLCGIAIEKKLYRERAREIKPFIQSSFMRVLYDCLVTVIPGWFAVKVLKPTFRVFKIFSYIKM